MADSYDVAARLAEGRQAVEHTQTYVRACQSVGYQQPDLTAHPSQVGDWYDTEAGLDLRVLDGDAAELRAAVSAIEEALWMQRTQVTELAAAWRGSGAESAMRFLQRHCDVAAQVASHGRAAAEHCATLRDDVWQAVDGKVATTVAIDERRAAERSAWLAAAHAVTAGSGDRSAAEVVVHRQVIPYVDNDIRNDWLAAMCSANASVASSYDTAIHSLASTGDVCFDIPGDLGPSWKPAYDECDATPAAVTLPAGPLPTVPAAAASPSPSIPEAPSADEPDAAASMPPEPADPLGDAAGLSAGAGGLGGLGGMTGGIGSVVGSIVDSIGSLLGSLAGGLGGSPDAGDDPVDVDDTDDPLVDDDADNADTDKPDADGPPSTGEAVPEPPVVENPTAAAEVVGEPAAQQVDPPADTPLPAEQSAPATAPADDGSTPCEIAEDQLPQVGQ
ncbi:hypothetical protein [Mycobacterium sp.]|uniref:hypothetical protein n=1 Tax=Mycobacterium sp. TaxID=1785 RepID=UPI003D1155DF